MRAGPRAMAGQSGVSPPGSLVLCVTWTSCCSERERISPLLRPPLSHIQRTFFWGVFATSEPPRCFEVHNEFICILVVSHSNYFSLYLMSATECIYAYRLRSGGCGCQFTRFCSEPAYPETRRWFCPAPTFCSSGETGLALMAIK